MEKRIAAYAFIFVAGMASACLGWALIEGPHALVRIITDPSWQQAYIVVLAGAAAVIAAGAVHVPFMRAARARRKLILHACAVFGVFLSHAAYVALVFLQFHFFEGVSSLEAQASMALAIGFIAFVLGVLPNTLAAVGLAQAVLWLGARRAGPAAPTVAAPTPSQPVNP